MVYVPAGSFEMGRTDGAGFEQPVHTVTLEGYWIDRTEVTNLQYLHCVAAGACTPPSRSDSLTRDTYYGDRTYANYPVISLDWQQAADYCEWAGARLPTEAEWEHAARGPEGHVYPWGDTFDGTRLNYCDASCPLRHSDSAFDDGHADTAPVGSFPTGASWCGALDLAGNIAEWVADFVNPYPSEDVVNPTGPADGYRHVIRGGSWYDNEVYTLSHRRFFEMRKQALRRQFGFRCARNAY
jgi:formylglycine-generating enzyme required for sulfatase activity